MRMAATFTLAILLTANVGPLSAADPIPPVDQLGPSDAIKASESIQRVEPTQPQQRPSYRRLDPSACAELCRFFERMWSLEKRAPEAPAPTS